MANALLGAAGCSAGGGVAGAGVWAAAGVASVAAGVVGGVSAVGFGCSGSFLTSSKIDCERFEIVGLSQRRAFLCS